MRSAKSLRSRDISFKYITTSFSNISFSISRQYGNAVKRNLLRRRCKYLYQIILLKKEPKISIIIKPNRKNISYKSLHKSFLNLYEKIYN